MDFQSAIKLPGRNVTNFEGRASLSAYWWYALGIFAVNMVLEIFAIAIGSFPLTMLFALVMIAVNLSGLSVAVRRMHDTGKSGWMLLLSGSSRWSAGSSRSSCSCSRAPRAGTSSADRTPPPAKRRPDGPGRRSWPGAAAFPGS